MGVLVAQQAHLGVDDNALLLRQQDGCCAVAVADGQVQRAILLSNRVVDISSSSNQTWQDVRMVVLDSKDQSRPEPPNSIPLKYGLRLSLMSFLCSSSETEQT